MGSVAGASPGLSLPRETFAKLTPGPFLEAHLQQAKPIRPNGRLPNEARPLTVNTGSLSHSNGSAVVRSGDTAVVCGVRAEILLASEIPHPPSDDSSKDDRLEKLGLLVPNLELSTGCSPAHLPGNPPGTLAQALSYRILSLLHQSKMIDLSDLEIRYLEPVTESDVSDEEPRSAVKAYWVLYIDLLCIALDGNAFDTAWTAVVAALQDVRLPKAWWDPDRETILCSPQASEASRVTLRSLPVPATAHIFTPSSQRKQVQRANSWMLVDSDAFEEDISSGSLTVVTTNATDGNEILRVERSGSVMSGTESVLECIKIASQRRKALQETFSRG